MEKQDLKLLLKDIADQDYAAPKNLDPYQLAVEMMKFLGDTDSEFRDELILSTLMEWINRDILTDQETFSILRIAMDEEHLLNGLGSMDDKVFCRTFSVEVIASAIYRHRMKSFVPEADLKNAFVRVIQFYNQDSDVRGYVDIKGWAHGAAHGADALDEFARCEEIGVESLHIILSAIRKKVNVNHYTYVHFEDERMVTAVIAVLERRLIPIEEIIGWVHGFETINKSEVYLENMAVEINVCNFLKSLYFRLIDKSEFILATDEIRITMKKVNRYLKKLS